MKFFKEKLSVLILLLLFLISGCTSEVENDSKAVREVKGYEPIKELLSENEFDLKSSLVSKEEIEEESDINSECSSELANSSYYRIELEGNFSIVFWLEEDSLETACLSFKGVREEDVMNEMGFENFIERHDPVVYIQVKTFDSCTELCEKRGFESSKGGGCINIFDCEVGEIFTSEKGAPCSGTEVCCCRGN